MLILICGLDSKDVPISVGRPRAFYNLTNCYVDHRYFCELGGMYKLWKQVNTDIVGLEHYRRFFTDSNAAPGTLLTENQIRDILSSHDIIMSPNHLYAPNVMTWMAQEKHNPNASTDTIVKEMLFKWFMYLRDNYSAELVDYTFHRMLTTRGYYGCNMFIGNKRVTDDYAQFLFPMLEKFTVDVMHGKYEQRLYGYLSEYTMGFWMEWRGYDIHSNSKVTYPAPNRN
jgi:hypothetical protein